MTDNGATQRLLDAIADYELMNRRSPTVREVARILNMSSSGTFTRIKQAASAGLVEYEPGVPRSLRVAGTVCPTCGR